MVQNARHPGADLVAGQGSCWPTGEGSVPQPDRDAASELIAVELALAGYEGLFGPPMIDPYPLDEQTGELLPAVPIATDNGGPFRSFRFEAFVELHPNLAHVHTRCPRQDSNLRHLL